MNTHQIIDVAYVTKRVNSDYYNKVNLPMPERPRNPSCDKRFTQYAHIADIKPDVYAQFQEAKRAYDLAKAEYDAALKAYNQESQRLEAEFWHDAAIACRVENHPKLGKLQHLAYEFGHSHGYATMWEYFSEMSDLLKDSSKN